MHRAHGYSAIKRCDKGLSSFWHADSCSMLKIYGLPVNLGPEVVI